jgi:hypothetical protein
MDVPVWVVIMGAILLGFVLALLYQSYQRKVPPPDHAPCYDEYLFRNFNNTGVTLRVQELTETVHHSKREKRFFHMMFESETGDHDDPRPLEVVKSIARDYLNALYLPLDAALRGIESRLGLPRLNPQNLDWVQLLEFNLQAALLFYENNLGDGDEPTRGEHAGDHRHQIEAMSARRVMGATAAPGAPTCCPHFIVTDPKNDEETLIAQMSLVLHRRHEAGNAGSPQPD